MLAGVDIEHEIDERALEPRARAPIDGKARSSDFRRALHVENAELRAEVPVRLRLEAHGARLAHTPDFHVVFLAPSNRNALVWHVWDPRHQFAERFVRRFHLLFERRDALPDGTNLKLAGGCIGAFTAQPCNLLRFRVAPCLQFLRFGYSGSTFLIQFAELVERRSVPASRQTRGNGVQVGPEIG